MITGIAIEKSTTGKESYAVQIYAGEHKIPCRFVATYKDIPYGWMAVGSVEFVEAALNRQFPPNHFPDFCKELIGRSWWLGNQNSLPPDKPVFIKPADHLKRFTGYVHQPENKEPAPAGPLIVQDTVAFTTEFRYYILSGQVIAAEWYPTPGQPEPTKIPTAPKLPIHPPTHWSGTLDFGETADGRFLLVEAHPPFACGWYGGNESKDFLTYAQWLIGGWESLTKK
jgi:hypothetical protein